MYKLNTGNVYRDVWTLRSGPQNFSQHEYSEFRWMELIIEPVNHVCAASAPGDYSSAVHLDCGEGNTIKAVTFASYGTPTGACVNGEEGWTARTHLGLDVGPRCDSGPLFTPLALFS